VSALAAVLAVVAFAAAPSAPPACARFPSAGDARQLITVEAPTYRTTHATLRLWSRGTGACWTAAGGPWAARVGRNGLSGNRREGDGTTPTGVYGIAPVMYGTAPDPGVRFAYRRLLCGDWWNEDAASPTYNSFQHVACGRRPPFRVFTPGMWEQPRAYPHLAVVEFNMHPVVPGRGSGIFLHVQTGGPTSGCISLERATLVRVLRWLRPDARPQIAIGTPAEIRR
jgi:L,D-peptidoglycan transpeptidase YkuD (ErfK/YbiS/YcfS/YnhG family)